MNTSSSMASNETNPFKELHDLVLKELYLPAEWGTLTVDTSVSEPKVQYSETNESEVAELELDSQEA